MYNDNSNLGTMEWRGCRKEFVKFSRRGRGGDEMNKKVGKKKKKKVFSSSVLEGVINFT